MSGTKLNLSEQVYKSCIIMLLSLSNRVNIYTMHLRILNCRIKGHSEGQYLYFTCLVPLKDIVTLEPVQFIPT